MRKAEWERMGAQVTVVGDCIVEGSQFVFILSYVGGQRGTVEVPGCDENIALTTTNRKQSHQDNMNCLPSPLTDWEGVGYTRQGEEMSHVV